MGLGVIGLGQIGDSLNVVAGHEADEVP